MSLSEETLSLKPGMQMPFTSCGSAINQQQIIRDQINADIEKFLQSGGRINDLTPAKNIIEPPVYESDLQKTMKSKKRERAHKAVASRVFVQSPISYMDGANRAMQKASSGHQNISSKQTKKGMRHSVVIGSTQYGTYDDIKDALAKRDAQRDILGMEKALY